MADEKSASAAGGNPFGEILVEIDTGRNDAVLFGPTQDRLRGRFDAHNFNMGETSAVGMLSMPQIPGMHIRLNVRERKAAIYDPLALPEMAAKLSEVSAKHKEIIRATVLPVPPVVRENMSQDDVATWLYWLMRAVHAKQAVVKEGQLPETENDIARAFPRGTKVRKEFYDTMGRSAEMHREAANQR